MNGTCNIHNHSTLEIHTVIKLGVLTTILKQHGNDIIMYQGNILSEKGPTAHYLHHPDNITGFIL